MTEEQLNENLIKSELQCICQDCIYLDKIVPIIRKMLSEEYKAGLEQSRFDKNMLERENQELKKQLEEIKNEPLTNRIGRIDSVVANIYSRNRTQKKEFIEYLENEIKNSDICDVYVHGMKFNSAEKMIYKDILSKYKEIIGVKDE